MKYAWGSVKEVYQDTLWHWHIARESINNCHREVREVNLSNGNNCRPDEGVSGSGLACYSERGRGRSHHAPCSHPAPWSMSSGLLDGGGQNNTAEWQCASIHSNTWQELFTLCNKYEVCAPHSLIYKSSWITLDTKTLRTCMTSEHCVLTSVTVVAVQVVNYY